MLPIVFRGHEDAGFFVHAVSAHGDRDLLRPTADNAPPRAGGYACVIPVQDYWRLNPGLCSREGVPHFAGALEPRILEDARSGRAVLVFDLCNEGPSFDRELFDHLHGFLDEHTVPRRQAVWLAQNRALQTDYLSHYGAAPADTLSFEFYDFFIKSIALHFHDQATAGPPAFDAERLIDAHFDADAKDRIYLCLNATPRPHRVLTVAALLYHDLLRDGLVSFPGLKYEKDPIDMRRVLQFIDEFPGFDYLRESCRAAVRLPELRVDAFAERGNSLFDMIDPECYRRTFFSIVTETEVSGGNVRRITEKSVKALALGHPSFILGNPGSLELLRELGFQPFDELLDLRHDAVRDPAERFDLMFRSINAQVAAIKHDRPAWLARAAPIGAANIRHAYGGGLLRRYIDRYDEPIVERLRSRLTHRKRGRPPIRSR